VNLFVVGLKREARCLLREKEIMMTQYMLSVFDAADQAELPPEAVEKIIADVDTLNDEFREAGAWVFGGGLHPADTATVVSVLGDETMITDGPFAETKEQIGGFWIIEAADLDAALEWAGKATRACQGPVEVRPFQDEPAA
jgi:hypothetical protein